MELGNKSAIVKQTLYDQVYKVLAELIADGRLPQNSYLPNEFELSRQFNVSIGTIRKAVEMLVQDRLLIRQQGRGTMVCDKRWLDVREKTNRIRHGAAAQILNWQRHIVESSDMPASEDVAARLRIRRDEEVHHVRSICTSACGSKIVEDIYVPVELADALAGERIAQDRFVRPVGRVEEACIAVLASESAAKLLQIAEGGPLLKMLRVVHDKDGAPMEYRVAYLQANGSFFYTSID